MAYEPGRSRVGEPTPQTDPDQFSADDIKAEIRYLRRLNRKYGEHTLRTLAIVRLTTTLATRQSVTPAIAGQPVQRYADQRAHDVSWQTAQERN